MQRSSLTVLRREYNEKVAKVQKATNSTALSNQYDTEAQV
jgi:hypothetical protein